MTDKLAKALNQVLADSYTLYLKTHNYHWNVTGPHFSSLHILFENQYNEIALAVDVIAERIRALGHHAPGSYAEFGKLTTITEAPAKPPKAMEMVKQLAGDQHKVVKAAHAALKEAEALDDDPTVDLMTQRMALHEKNAWMLESLLE